MASGILPMKSVATELRGVRKFSLIIGTITETLMAIIAKTGKMKEIWLPVTASTVLSKNSLVTFTSGQLVAATAGTTAVALAGVIERAITAADADYATGGRLVPIKVPVERHATFECDGTGTFAATDVGAEFDLSTALVLDKAATTTKVAKIVKFISASKVIAMLKINYGY